MIPCSLKAPTIPITFRKAPKIVAMADAENAQTEELLAEIPAENFRVEISRDLKRDANEDADVGACIVLVDAERLAGPRELASAVRTPHWVLANSHQLADLAVVDGPGEIDGDIYPGQQTSAYYARQVMASLIKYGMSPLPRLFGGLVSDDAEARSTFDCPGHQGGIAALTRADAPAGLREVLGRTTRPDRPIWRASPAQLLNAQTFSTVGRSPMQRWLAERMENFQLSARVISASSYEDDVRQELDRKANVFFAGHAVLQDQASRNPAGDNLLVLIRRFSYAPISTGVARGDEDLRLLVDRTLSPIFKSGDYRASYVKWFGQPDEDAQHFYRLAICRTSAPPNFPQPLQKFD